MGLQCPNPHTDTPNPDHPDDGQTNWEHFLNILLVPRIPKWYHTWGYNDKILIRFPKSSKSPFWTFLIILMVTKKPRNTSWTFPWSYRFKKGIICWVTMTKSPSRLSKSSKSPLFWHSGLSWSSWWWPNILETLPEHSHGPKDSKKVSYVGVTVEKTKFSWWPPYYK